MTGYYITGWDKRHKHAVLSTWAPTHSQAEKYAASISHKAGVENVMILPDRDLSDLGEVYHETPTVEAQMDDFDTRAAALDKEVEGAHHILARHRLDRYGDIGDALSLAVAEVIRKLEAEVVWAKHESGLD